MIQSIEIKNFQSHKHSLLEFSPHINNIIGSSNSGKSAVLRALNWVINNRPSGDSIISNFNKEKNTILEPCEVTVIIDGHIVKRIKDKNQNIYILDDKKYEAIGTDTPEEIKTLFNMSEINIQQQLDAPFLLSQTPGEVAKFFNKIVKLDKIDEYLYCIESKKRKTKNDIQLTKTNLENIGNELLQYTWLEKANTLITTIEQISQTLNIIQSQIQNLNETITVFKTNQKILQQTNIIITADNHINTITTLLQKQQQIIQSKNILINTISNYKQNKNIITNTTFIPHAIQYIEQITNTNINLHNIQQIHQHLNEMITEYTHQHTYLQSTPNIIMGDKIIIKLTNFLSIKNNLQNNKQTLITNIYTVQQLQQTLQNLYSEIENTEQMLPSICPLCGSILHK